MICHKWANKRIKAIHFGPVHVGRIIWKWAKKKKKKEKEKKKRI